MGRPVDRSGAARALREHWPEYLMEALGLGLFMVSACAFGTLLEHPELPVRRAIADPDLRRALMGAAMGLTAIGLIYSPWGRRSGAHMNPAVTLAFARLGHVRRWDTLFYALAQFAGGALGVALMARLLGPLLAHPNVDFVVTRPGPGGEPLALAAEVAISFGLMLLVIQTSARPRLVPWTGVLAGALLGLWIMLAAPISGTSMNPARTFASALAAGEWSGWWVYFVAPPLGMLAAAELSCTTLMGRRGCAKLHHPPDERCIFCGQGMAPRDAASAPAGAAPTTSRAEAGPAPGTFPAPPALKPVSRQP